MMRRVLTVEQVEQSVSVYGCESTTSSLALYNETLRAWSRPAAIRDEDGDEWVRGGTSAECFQLPWVVTV